MNALEALKQCMDSQRESRNYLWCRPTAWRGCGQAITWDPPDGWKTVPSLKGGWTANLPCPKDLFGEWEMVDPAAVAQEDVVLTRRMSEIIANQSTGNPQELGGEDYDELTYLARELAKRMFTPPVAEPGRSLGEAPEIARRILALAGEVALLIPFRCPKCAGESEKGELICGAIFAGSKVKPCIRCVDCGTEWGVNLYEVGI